MRKSDVPNDPQRDPDGALQPALFLGGLVAAACVAGLGLVGTDGPRRTMLSETQAAQRATMAIARAYRAEVGLDRRDRTILLSYADTAVMSADQVAQAACDTVLNDAGIPRPGAVLRGWQVVALPDRGHPGSCRVGSPR